MISRPVLAALVFIGCASLGVAQQSAVPEPYSDDDAYQIYSLLLPHEELYGSPQSTLVILGQTAPGRDAPFGPESCLYPNAADRFKDAMTDYQRINQKGWLLQRDFQLEKLYELVSSNTLKVLFDEGGWDSYYKRYPDSGGYLMMSAVGFNQEKTRGVVYMGGTCGSLCGSWSFHLLEKVDGKWKEVPGVSCHTVSSLVLSRRVSSEGL